MIKSWLGDHFRWYRKLKGGRWGKWNGFWEREELVPNSKICWLRFKRGYRGINVVECTEVWDYDQVLDYNDEIIEDREDYTHRDRA